jgi:Rieske Fe-S protein
MERRTFIIHSCIACASGLGLSRLLTACTPNKYVTAYALSQNRLTIKKSEFSYSKKGLEKQHSFILVKPAGMQFPMVVYRLANGEYTALYLQCTHQGCELNAYETTMVCPCHGAEFNLKGDVIQGPAESALQKFKITHDNENIYVQL